MQTNQKPSIHLSVVVPTRHEAGTVAPFLYRLAGFLDHICCEIIVVDDSDRDRTLAEVLAVQRELGEERLVVIHREPTTPDRTLGTAVVEGLRQARGSYVCVMDSDGQHPPETIPRLLDVAVHDDADYVGGSRYLSGGSAKGLDGRGRKLISLSLSWMTRLLFALTPIRGLTDPLSGFFLFRRSAVDAAELRPIGWKISLEILARGRLRRVREVPYAFANRDDGVSKASFSQGMLLLRHMLLLLTSMPGVRRALTFGVVGLSGVCVNTGALLALRAAGFDALAWPIWLAAELSILWNYVLNRSLTWRQRRYGSWWTYNLAACSGSVIAIRVTTWLAADAGIQLTTASLLGIGAGMALNFVVFDRLVFRGVARLRGATARAPADLGPAR